MKKGRLFLLIIACFGAMATSGYLGYRVFLPHDSTEIDITPVIAGAETVIEPQYEINASTVIVYEHFDVTTGQTHVTSGTAPNFMQNRTKQELASTFIGWDIVSFTEEQVELRRTVETIPDIAYTIGVIGNFLTIYNGDRESIKEITRITINHLHEEERKRLEAGIPIASRNELIRRLEDYSS